MGSLFMANFFISVLLKAVLPKAGRFAEGARRPSAYSTSAAIRIAPARGEAAMIKQVFERYLSLLMYPVLALGSNKVSVTASNKRLYIRQSPLYLHRARVRHPHGRICRVALQSDRHRTRRKRTTPLDMHLSAFTLSINSVHNGVVLTSRYLMHSQPQSALALPG